MNTEQQIGYVTYLADGALDGAYLQVPPAEHAGRMIVVSEAVRADWLLYRANPERNGLEPAPAALDLDAIRAAQWEAIKRERDRIKCGGVEVDGHWFHTDDSSRIQQIGLVIMGAGVPAVQWKTMSGAFVPMTQALASAIFAAVATLDQEAFANAEAHRVAMEAAADPASYDFSTGWPASYEPA